MEELFTLSGWLTPGSILAALAIIVAIIVGWLTWYLATRKPPPLPVIYVAIGAETVGIWRHAVAQFDNPRAEPMKVVGVRIGFLPRTLRLARFDGHDKPPLGGPSKRLDIDLLLPPRRNPKVDYGFDNRRSFEFYYRLPNTPDADAGTEIDFTFEFREEAGNRRLLFVPARGRVPPYKRALVPPVQHLQDQ
jgi:hypothetical protein